MKSNAFIVAALAITSLSVGCARQNSSTDLASVANTELQAGSTQQTHGDDFIQRDSGTNEILNVEDSHSKAVQKYTYFISGSAKKWAGTVSWYYNPAGQPTFFGTQEVIDRLVAATKQWEAVAGVKFQYMGITTNAASTSGCDNKTVVGWAPLTNNTVGYTQACFSSNTFSEFDMQLDNRSGSYVNTLSYVQQVAVHEFGHAIGMGHTDINPAVMTPILSSSVLVQDDIDGVRSLYGYPTSSPTPTPTPVPTATPAPTATPSSSWVVCANEGGTCSFSGTRYVRYGAGGAFVTKTFTGSVSCTNDVFGDPAWGVAKHCEYSASTVSAPTATPTPTPAPTPIVDSSWTRCASEWQVCSFSGTRTVRYGANGVFVTKQATGSISCTNDVFGDPVPGTQKYCEYSSSTTTVSPTPAPVSYSYCAGENGYCSFSGTRTVRYGANGVYTSKVFTGGVSCSNSVFGDPLPGTYKQCEVSSQ